MDGSREHEWQNNLDRMRGETFGILSPNGTRDEVLILFLLCQTLSGDESEEIVRKPPRDRQTTNLFMLIFRVTESPH
jgi:hypothetical protein